MADTHIAAAPEVERFAAHRMAAAAAAKAKQMWPDAIGDVLAEEIMAMLDLPRAVQLDVPPLGFAFVGHALLLPERPVAHVQRVLRDRGPPVA